MLLEIREIGREAVKRLRKWIEFDKEREDKWYANLIEDDLYNVHILPIFNTYRNLLNRIRQDVVVGSKEDEYSLRCKSELDKYERICKEILHNYYRESAIEELKKTPEYSILDFDYGDINEGLESNFFRYLKREIVEKNNINAVLTLTALGIEYGGKVFFMPFLWVRDKLKQYGFVIEIPEGKLEEEIEKMVIEEELHKVLTKYFGGEVSRKLDSSGLNKYILEYIYD